MEYYIKNPNLIKRHGQNGRKRVIDLFNKDLVSQAWADYFKKKINEKEIEQNL